MPRPIHRYTRASTNPSQTVTMRESLTRGLARVGCVAMLDPGNTRTAVERDLRVRYRLTARLKGGTGSGIRPGKRVMNVAHLLTEAAKDRPHHTALFFEDRAFTYEALDRLTDRAASALTGLGAGRGEVVAIFLDSGPELLVGYLGALKAGAVPNVVNAALQPEEVRHVVADSAPGS